LVLKKKKSPLFNQAKRNVITKSDPKSPISEQYRTIRTNILFSSVDKEMKSFLVTSSAPSEGKSTTASNLAVVFAQQNKKVLLVDADLRKPTMHYTFQLINASGLTTVLSQQAELSNVAHPTDVPNLFVLSSGPIPPNPAELLSSQAMGDFLEAAYEKYDLVIFDTPPVLAVTDAQVLANKCDGTILVVNSGNTEIEAAQKAKELLQSAKGKLIGVVLNNRKLKESNHYYYYGNA